MAFFDDLTGHLNRARLQEALDEILETCRRDGTTAAYLMVNIDRLGLLNDAYGFDIADTVIMDIGKRVEDCTRVGDIIGRAGGNQFGLILPDAGDVELRNVADQILTTTRRREVNTGAGELIPASLFIPVVEKLGLIRRLDIFTLEMALLEMEQVADINLAVNISGMTATDPSSLDQLLSLVHIHSGVADRLIFEITETVAMMEFEETARFANKLRDLGCRIALDDFGAGYTSYRHLKALAVDIVKIDGQFVKDLHTNRENQLFVQTLLDLGHGFNAQVVGECVETEDEAQALRDRGVKYLQGYHFGAPTLERPRNNGNLQVVQSLAGD
jgi:diguanylate cyclase (GGDEF)-like protein